MTATGSPGKRIATAGSFAEDNLFGWAGWTPLQRMKALLGIDEGLEDKGVPVSDRVGVLDSAWRLLPSGVMRARDGTRSELPA